jgi:hypothetical protein
MLRAVVQPAGLRAGHVGRHIVLDVADQLSGDSVPRSRTAPGERARSAVA